MRLDAVLDSFYVLGSLWGGVSGHQVCPASPAVPASTAREVAWALVPKSPAGVTAFVDVNVVPMDTERVLAHYTVLVEGGKITALGPMSQVRVPAGAARIDGQGKYLIPGLGDMHFHNTSVTEANLRTSLRDILSDKLARGITTVRHLSAQTSKASTIRQLEGINLTPEQMRRYVDTTDVAIPRIYLSADIPRSLTPDSANAYVAAAKAAGYRHITLPFGYTSMGDEERKRSERVMVDSLLAAARRGGLRLASHSHKLSFEKVLALGSTGGSTEHVYMYWDSLGYTLGTPDSNANVLPAKLQALAAAAKQAGVWVTPTLKCSEGVYAAPAHIKVLRQIVKALHDAGVGLLLSEDDGKYDAPVELMAFVDAGLTPYQALLTGTRNPAQFLGVLDSSGTVAVGKWADLVLLSGNPLMDIQHARNPVGVMIAGRWVPLDQRQRTP